VLVDVRSIFAGCHPRAATPTALSQKQRRGVRVRRKSRALVPRYYKFESISLQRRVHELSVPERSRFLKVENPAFRAGLGSWLPDRVSRDSLGFDIASTGGNISVGRYSSTAVRLVVAPGLTRDRSVDL
jgi:hypothetical protein